MTSESSVICPVRETLDLIGGKYKPLILWHLLEGRLRFSELARLIPCAGAKMLTKQLRELEADGLVSREVFPEVPPRVEYSLTEEGKTLEKVLQALYDWGTIRLQKNGLKATCGMHGSKRVHPNRQKAQNA